MNDHPGRLVDDEEIRVLIDDVEIVVFWLWPWAYRLGNVNGDPLAGAHDPVRRHGLAGNGDLTVLDQALDLRARLAAQYAREIPVDADTSLVCRHEELFMLCRVGPTPRSIRAACRDPVAPRRVAHYAARLADLTGSGVVRRRR